MLTMSVSASELKPELNKITNRGVRSVEIGRLCRLIYLFIRKEGSAVIEGEDAAAHNQFVAGLDVFGHGTYIS